jgi:hypothetical protein
MVTRVSLALGFVTLTVYRFRNHFISQTTTVLHVWFCLPRELDYPVFTVSFSPLQIIRAPAKCTNSSWNVRIVYAIYDVTRRRQKYRWTDRKWLFRETIDRLLVVSVEIHPAVDQPLVRFLWLGCSCGYSSESALMQRGALSQMRQLSMQVLRPPT